MASDAVTVIMNDHRLLEQLFERLRSGQGDRRELVAEVGARLTAHSRAEERQVYPELAKADPGEKGEVRHGVEEHHEAERLLKRLERIDPDSAEFPPALAELVQAVQHHVAEEESEVLPALRDAVDADRLAELGRAFDQARLEELQRAGLATSGRSGGGPGGRSGGGRGGRGGGRSAGRGNQPRANGGSGLQNATRQELYERARQANIEGRSTMSKEELIKALSRKR